MVSSKQTGEPPFTIHDSPLTEFLAFAHELADAAGAAIRPYFGAHGKVESKADDSPVTHADRAAEYAMRTLIAERFPQHGIFGEEFGESSGHPQPAITEASRASEPSASEAARRVAQESNPKQSNTYTWVLDPIDGTRAFIAGGNEWGTLIALCENGVPILGVLDQPVTGERWVGARGMATQFFSSPPEGERGLPWQSRGGSSLRIDALPITPHQNSSANFDSPSRGELFHTHTRPCASLANAAISTTSARYFKQEQAVRFAKLAEQCAEVIAEGDCIAYGLLARGARDIVVDVGVKPYDILALVPIIEGAGGKITGWDGAPVTLSNYANVVAAGDAALHETAIKNLM